MLKIQWTFQTYPLNLYITESVFLFSYTLKTSSNKARFLLPEIKMLQLLVLKITKIKVDWPYRPKFI